MQLVQRRSAGKTLVMAVLGAVAGYIVLALASTLVQEIWLGGVSYRDSERSVLILAGLFTPLCAFLGGVVSSFVATHSRWPAAALLSALIATETTYLYLTGRVDGPLWFEAGAGAALIGAVFVGAWLYGRLLSRRGRL
jgi:hypothetical protein